MTLFAGDGRHRDQVCSRCHRSWSCVRVLEDGSKVCGDCLGWHDDEETARGGAALAGLVAAIAAQRSNRGIR